MKSILTAAATLLTDPETLRVEPGGQAEDASVNQELVVGATITVSERSKS